jgi:hypothetical protein
MNAFARRKGDFVLLTALASGQTVRDAAQAAGLAESTVRRRLADTDFARRVSQARMELLGQALGRLAEGMTAAADTLVALLGHGSGTVKLGAARSVIEMASKLREHSEFEARLEALEARNDGQPQRATRPA